MLFFHNLREGLPVFKCLSSPLRISILELLMRDGPMSMTEIAERVGVTGGALTPHIKQLSGCGLICIQFVSGRHGLQRVCAANECRILVDPTQATRNANVYETEIDVGQYTGYEAFPTCGLATTEHIIGAEDNPQYFASPERVNAGILWIRQGYFEYVLHNFLQPDQELIELQISMELASEAPGSSENWPSDIHFYLNGSLLCHWTSPADFGRVHGIYTPDWWDLSWNQYGLFKLLSIDGTGTYIDGTKRSDVVLQDLNIAHNAPLVLRVGVPKEAEHVGGLTIYGRGFGNYDQGIKVRMHYRKR